MRKTLWRRMARLQFQHAMLFSSHEQSLGSIPSQCSVVGRQLQTLRGAYASKKGRRWRVSVFSSRWRHILEVEGVPEADWSVKWIMEHVLRTTTKHPRTSPYMTPQQVSMATELLNKRIRRVPVQYLIGEWDFRYVTLTMRPPVFVPTPETEELVGHVIEHCYKRADEEIADYRSGRGDIRAAERERENKKRRGACYRMLDLCCGSGAIAVALLKECPKVEVVAVDISSAAVELTKHNAMRNGVSERLSVLHMSVKECLAYFLKRDVKFDCIVSNPPYLRATELPTLEPEIRQFMDRRALDGGDKGLDVAIEILSTCKHYLQPHGEVWLEMGHLHQEDISRLVSLHPTWHLTYVSHYLDFNKWSRFHQLRVNISN